MPSRVHVLCHHALLGLVGEYTETGIQGVAVPALLLGYAVGVLLLAVVFALTLGSIGSRGRPFAADLAQADSAALLSAFAGGIVFNLANILIVAAIDIAGMAVAFP